MVILSLLVVVTYVLATPVEQNDQDSNQQVQMMNEECDESDPRHRRAFIDDCSKYYYCYENVLEVVPCPNGFIFDSDVGACRRGDKETCS